MTPEEKVIDTIYKVARIAFWEAWQAACGDMPIEQDWRTSDVLLLLDSTYGGRPGCDESLE